MKLHDKITDAQLRQALRSLEVKGLIRSEIDAAGKLRFYAAEYWPKLVSLNQRNFTTLSNAARKRRREGNLMTSRRSLDQLGVMSKQISHCEPRRDSNCLTRY